MSGLTLERVRHRLHRFDLRIEEDLGDIAHYPGREAFYNLR